MADGAEMGGLRCAGDKSEPLRPGGSGVHHGLDGRRRAAQADRIEGHSNEDFEAGEKKRRPSSVSGWRAGRGDEGRGSRRRGLAVGVWFGVWGWREMDLVCVVWTRYGTVAKSQGWTRNGVDLFGRRRGRGRGSGSGRLRAPSLTAEQHSSQTDRQGWREQKNA